MYNHYKLLVTDIDGTLVDKTGKIADIDRQAIQKIHEKGIGVSLCTGRAARGCLKVLEELGLDGFHIFFDGALVCNSDRTEELFSRPVRTDLMKQICSFADSHHMALEVFTKTDYFISHSSIPASIHADILQFPPVVTDFTNIPDDAGIIMGCIVTNSADEQAKIKDFSSAFNGRLRFSWTWHPAYPDYYFINVTAPGISKGKALETLITHLGLKKDQVMAIGDGANDVSLLSAAGLAVAMRNSPEELKAVAGYIAPDIDHNGVAETINRFFK
jgi:5-amino-6-(5-phospho-D-ribitylamino)uracil phosphatase